MHAGTYHKQVKPDLKGLCYARMLFAIAYKQPITRPLNAKKENTNKSWYNTFIRGPVLSWVFAAHWPLQVCLEGVGHCYRLGYLMTSTCRRIWAGEAAVLTLWGQSSLPQTPVVTDRQHSTGINYQGSEWLHKHTLMDKYYVLLQTFHTLGSI